MLPLAREEVDLFALVRRLVTARANAIDAAGLSLDLRGTSATTGTIEGDPKRLARAFGHLLDNANAATQQRAGGGGRILVDVGRHRGKSRDVVRIVVSDNGPGMDAASLARALDGFKLSEDGTAVERRQGLGLPLARQLIEAHGGHLELMSAPGEGTAAIAELG